MGELVQMKDTPMFLQYPLHILLPYYYGGEFPNR